MPAQKLERGSVPYMLRLGEKLRRERLVASCITCSHFNDKLEMCKLVMLRPPANVIALGCEAWDDDRVPF